MPQSGKVKSFVINNNSECANKIKCTLQRSKHTYLDVGVKCLKSVEQTDMGLLQYKELRGIMKQQWKCLEMVTYERIYIRDDTGTIVLVPLK